MQTQQVGDVNNHALGLFRSPGIAVFPDGSTGAVLAINTFYAILGVEGTANGYYVINFADDQLVREPKLDGDISLELIH
jgi:hypothetical protein